MCRRMRSVRCWNDYKPRKSRKTKKMIFIQVKVNEGPVEKTRRFLLACARANEIACRMWANEFLPGHFKRGAHGKYDYAPRSSKYLKRRDKRGKPDLVFSGRSRDLLTNKGLARFRTTKSESIFTPVVGNNIRYFWMRPKNNPDKPAEMKAVNDDEVRKIQKVYKLAVMSEMAREPQAEKPDYRF